MSHQYKAVAAILKNTISSINEILKDPADEMHRIRITGVLQQSHDQLLLLTGTGDLETGKGAVLGPAKTIGGKPIPKLRKFTADDMIPADDKVNNLRKQVEDAEPYFNPLANPEGILANIPELIIRGVAKKAGLKVTKDDPVTITVQFIEEIKSALAFAAAAGNNTNDNEDEDDDDVESKDFDEKEYHAEPFIKVGEGGISEVQTIPLEDISSSAKEVQTTQPAEVILPAPEVEQPKLEEPKQDQKPEPKKKSSK